MDASIIIVNYNTKNLTINCINSVREKTTGLNYEIIVVDNNSSDCSIESIENLQYNNVICIRSDSNVGFGRANNIGVKEAKGKYVLLLNSDTVIKNNAIKCFYDFAEAHDQNTILGSILYSSDDTPTTSSGNFEGILRIGLRIIYLLFPLLLSIRLKTIPIVQNTEGRDVDYVSGADMFMRKDIFEKLGGFDKNIFMYCEDSDICLRAKKIGIKSHLITSPHIIHLEGKSSKKTWKSRKMQIKSNLYYLKKCYRKKINRLIQ